MYILKLLITFLCILNNILLLLIFVIGIKKDTFIIAFLLNFKNLYLMSLGYQIEKQQPKTRYEHYRLKLAKHMSLILDKFRSKLGAENPVKMCCKQTACVYDCIVRIAS